MLRLIVFACCLCPAPLGAQSPQDDVDLLKQQRDMSEKAANDHDFQLQIEGIRKERAALSQALIATSNAIEGDETLYADREHKISALKLEQAHLFEALQSRKRVLAKVLAALQRLGHDPPPALLVDPANMVSAVRTAIVLGAFLPGLEADVAAISKSLSDYSAVHLQLEQENEKAMVQMRALEAERDKLEALIAQRQNSLTELEKQMAERQARTANVPMDAADVGDLIRQSAQAQTPIHTDKAPANNPAASYAQTSGQPLTLPLTQPLTPQKSFAALRGSLTLPVTGSVVRAFGTPDNFGGYDQGITLVARDKALVRAPADGVVAYAGNFRAYGPLVIMNMGDGYFIIVAGMASVFVQTGQVVLAQEPIGLMNGAALKDSAQNPFLLSARFPVNFGGVGPAPAPDYGLEHTQDHGLGDKKSILYVEFWKDGTAIDSAPWWIKPPARKVHD